MLNVGGSWVSDRYMVPICINSATSYECIIISKYKSFFKVLRTKGFLKVSTKQNKVSYSYSSVRIVTALSDVHPNSPVSVSTTNSTNQDPLGGTGMTFPLCCLRSPLISDHTSGELGLEIASLEPILALLDHMASKEP